MHTPTNSTIPYSEPLKFLDRHVQGSRFNLQIAHGSCNVLPIAMLKQRHVAIFWELGKCSIHSSISGHRIVDKIRELSQQLGTVKSFKGYVDLTTFGAPDTLRRRSELHASGVSLIDCPATDCSSISRKTMLVDMFLLAADNPPPVTFLIITGDDDFAYAISMLRLRRYEVVLVCPKSLGGQHTLASTYVDWQDVFGTDLAVVHNLGVQSGVRDALSSGADDVEAPATAAEQGNSSLVIEQLRDCDSAFRNDAPGSSVERDLGESLSSQVETVGNCRTESLDSAFIGLAPTQIIPQPQHKEEPERCLPHIACSDPSLAPLSRSSLSPAPTQSSSEGLHPPFNCRPSDLAWHAGRQFFDTRTSDEPSRSYHPQSEPPSSIRPSASALAIAQRLPTGLKAPLSPELDMKSSVSSSAYVNPLPTNLGHALSTFQMSPPLSETSSDTVVPISPGPSTPRLPVALSSQPLASAPTVTARCPLSLKARLLEPVIVPTHFALLVAKLQAYRAQGNLKPFRPGLAAEIVSLHNGDMCKAGTSTFTQYAQAAERAGIVELSRPDEGCWIALRPEFYDYPTE